MADTLSLMGLLSEALGIASIFHGFGWIFSVLDNKKIL
jgi:hypothetical protein